MNLHVWVRVFFRYLLGKKKEPGNLLRELITQLDLVKLVKLPWSNLKDPCGQIQKPRQMDRTIEYNTLID